MVTGTLGPRTAGETGQGRKIEGLSAKGGISEKENGGEKGGEIPGKFASSWEQVRKRKVYNNNKKRQGCGNTGCVSKPGVDKNIGKKRKNATSLPAQKE